MNTHYLVITYDESPSLGGSTAHMEPDALTLPEALRKLARPTDYIVAVEDGVVRPLTQSEEAELQRERPSRTPSEPFRGLTPHQKKLAEYAKEYAAKKRADSTHD